MFASIKKAVGIKTAKKPPPFDVVAYFAQFEDDSAIEKAGRPWRPKQNIPSKFPGKHFHKCDIPWCEYPNPPRIVPGDHRCGLFDCPGNFHVTPELAAANAIDIDRRARKVVAREAVDSLTLGDKRFLEYCGQSALERRTYAASYRSVATAPAFVQFPRDPERSAGPKVFPSDATLRRRQHVHRPRPSLPSKARGGDPPQR
ncbi:hypothetical protein B0H11DRAFT_250325 [Mycena galericulata]|nr:hypothetical protein B0H11DRAFT_250325 [Mycena galericulata]